MQDEELWEMVQREERLLITTDKGFTRFRATHHYGILVVRLRQPNRHRIHHRIMQAMAQFTETEWPGLLVVMRDVAQGIWRSQGNGRESWNPTCSCDKCNARYGTKFSVTLSVVRGAAAPTSTVICKTVWLGNVIAGT
jgi:uncharacterized protein with PIN domain